MGLDSTIFNGSVYLDTNIFIYLVEGFADYHDCLKQLFQTIDKGELPAYTSELTLAEVLVKPLLESNISLSSLYENLIQTGSFFQVLPINRSILISAARMRAQSSSRIALPDAIHLATAGTAGCRSFLTNDGRLQRQDIIDLDVLLLDNLV